MTDNVGIFHELPSSVYLASVLLNNCERNDNNDRREESSDRVPDDDYRNGNNNSNNNNNNTNNNNNNNLNEIEDEKNRNENIDEEKDSEHSDCDGKRQSTRKRDLTLVDCTAERFVCITKKLRQQILSRILSRLRNQLVMYNVKALFRVYMIYHRDDRLIYSICDVFNKRRVYDAGLLRQEIIAKNTKSFQRKVLRNKFCNEVMMSQPHILRLFDTRALMYYRRKLMSGANSLHNLSNRLPVIMCLKEDDIDVIFDRCRFAHSRRYDFPIDLLPSCIRQPFGRLLGVVGY